VLQWWDTPDISSLLPGWSENFSEGPSENEPWPVHFPVSSPFSSWAEIQIRILN
jgi:hypothetical protein